MRRIDLVLALMICLCGSILPKQLRRFKRHNAAGQHHSTLNILNSTCLEMTVVCNLQGFIAREDNERADESTLQEVQRVIMRQAVRSAGHRTHTRIGAVSCSATMTNLYVSSWHWVI